MKHCKEENFKQWQILTAMKSMQIAILDNIAPHRHEEGHPDRENNTHILMLEEMIESLLASAEEDYDIVDDGT